MTMDALNGKVRHIVKTFVHSVIVFFLYNYLKISALLFFIKLSSCCLLPIAKHISAKLGALRVVTATSFCSFICSNQHLVDINTRRVNSWSFFVAHCFSNLFSCIRRDIVRKGVGRGLTFLFFPDFHVFLFFFFLKCINCLSP